MKNIIKYSLSLLLILFGQGWGLACTTFCLDHDGRPFYGRNFDWRLGGGSIYINKRGVEKTALGVNPDNTDPGLSWISRYGSATFNLFGREFPLGGMNEAGLVVESLMLDETRYPSAGERPEIMAAQWIQYQLDNFARVEEVIASDSMMRIHQTRDAKFHFLVCEHSGECAAFEFIDEEMIVHRNDRLEAKVLTNSPYAESLSYWKKGGLPQYDTYRSVERFSRSADMLRDYAKATTENPVDYAFKILKEAEHDNNQTQWSTVYNIEDLTIYFRTLENQHIRFFGLQSFDLSCATPVKVLDINTELSEEISDKFIDYTYQINRNLIGEAFRKTPGFSNTPEHVLDMRSKYPEGTICIK